MVECCVYAGHQSGKKITRSSTRIFYPRTGCNSVGISILRPSRHVSSGLDSWVWVQSPGPGVPVRTWRALATHVTIGCGVWVVLDGTTDHWVSPPFSGQSRLRHPP